MLLSCTGGKAGEGHWNVAWGLSKYFCLEQRHVGATSAGAASLGLKIKDPTEIL